VEGGVEKKRVKKGHGSQAKSIPKNPISKAAQHRLKKKSGGSGRGRLKRARVQEGVTNSIPLQELKKKKKKIIYGSEQKEAGRSGFPAIVSQHGEGARGSGLDNADVLSGDPSGREPEGCKKGGG